MRSQFESCKRTRLTPSILILASAAVLAGCSSSGLTRMSSTSFDGPLTTGTITPTAPVGQAVGQQPIVNAPPVYTQQIAPPPVASAPQPTYQPAPVNTAAAIAPRVNNTPDNGASVVVQPGETVYRIATRNGISVNSLMSANGISDPSRVRAGQRLVLPGRGAPVQAASTARTTQPATAQQSVRYTVAANDTLYSIGRRHGVSPDRIASANSIVNNNIRVGQSLVIPGATRMVERPAASATAPVQTAAVGNTAPVTRTAPPANKPVEYQPPRRANTQIAPRPAQPQAEQQVAALPAQTPAAQAAPKATPSAESTSRFRWPAKGRVIEEFGQKAGGARNDGIKIALPSGTPIRAAEAGVVAYAGDELKGYGNLVLIRHSDDWVTAYAHANSLSVKRGDRVTRGQVIGEVGQTGAVSAPQLHFEVRKGSQPVDPMRHLASL